MANSKNKTHIGFFLDLNKVSDREINHILQTIPTYDNKTAYIKRAIAFYNKYCNDNNGYGLGSVPSYNGGMFLGQMPTASVGSPFLNADNTRNIEAEKPEKENKTKEEKEESPENIVINNNSDISEDADYSSLMAEFFG